jgi:hypothetical protein
MKFSDIERGDLRTNVDGPVRELMSLGSETRKATNELADKLDALSKQADPDISHDSIDRMMRGICDHHGCKASELHDDFIAAKGMTPDQYVRERIQENGKSMLENSEFREFDVFVVQIPANVFAGRNYNYSTVPYRVYKGMDGVNTESDAIRWVNDNQDTVLADIEGKRIRVGSRTVPHVKKPAIDNVHFKNSYYVKLSKISHAVDHPNPKANYMPPSMAQPDMPVRESMQPGDVLMIENAREAVVGTVLSIDEGMIILEGGVFPLDETDIDDIDTNTIDEMLDEHLREALAEYPELYENDEKYKGMTGFLSSYDTINAVPDTNYIYVVVQTVPVAGIVSIGYFPESKRLIRVVDNRYLFDIGGEVKAFPAGDHSGTDLFRKSFLFSSIEEFIEFKTMLTLKFGNWRMRTNPIFKPIDISEAKYQGREIKLGKPMRVASGLKKFKVYVRDPKTGNIKKVMFGDKNMEIKRDDPARRKSFRARHGCGTARASDRTKAAYWSCRLWSTTPVSKITK